MTSLLLVFKNLASLRIHSDFVLYAATLDIEGVAKTAAAPLALQFFVGNRSRLSFERMARASSMLTFAPFASFSPV